MHVVLAGLAALLVLQGTSLRDATADAPSRFPHDRIGSRVPRCAEGGAGALGPPACLLRAPPLEAGVWGLGAGKGPSRLRLRGGGGDSDESADAGLSGGGVKRSPPGSLEGDEHGGRQDKRGRLDPREGEGDSSASARAGDRGDARRFVSLGDSLPSDVIDRVYDELGRNSEYSMPPARGTDFNFTEYDQEESAINMSFPEGSVFEPLNETDLRSGVDGANRALVSEEDGSGESESVVNVDFEMFDPVEQDRYYILSLLNSFLEGRTFEAGDMVDTIIEQGKRVGTVQRIANQSEAYGFITCLNLYTHNDTQWAKQILSFVRSKCPKEQLQALDSIIGSKSTAHNGTTRPPRIGLILSERVPNLPHSLAAPLVNSLFDELAWARGEKDEGEGGQASVGEGEAVLWAMDWYLALTTRVLPGTKFKKGAATDPDESQPTKLRSPVDIWGSSIAAARGEQSWETSAPGGVDFRPRPEDQAFGEVAELRISYPMSNDCRTTMQEERVTRIGEIFLFPVSKEAQVRKRVLELAGDEAVQGQAVDAASYVWRDGRFH